MVFKHIIFGVLVLLNYPFSFLVILALIFKFLFPCQTMSFKTPHVQSHFYFSANPNLSIQLSHLNPFYCFELNVTNPSDYINKDTVCKDANSCYLLQPPNELACLLVVHLIRWYTFLNHKIFGMRHRIGREYRGYQFQR